MWPFRSGRIARGGQAVSDTVRWGYGAGYVIGCLCCDETRRMSISAEGELDGAKAGHRLQQRRLRAVPSSDGVSIAFANVFSMISAIYDWQNRPIWGIKGK
jgi:hypothetical protein